MRVVLLSFIRVVPLACDVKDAVGFINPGAPHVHADHAFNSNTTCRHLPGSPARGDACLGAVTVCGP